MAILTNKLHIEIDYDKLDSFYDIFSVETTDDYIKSGASILDTPETERNIKSISFTSGKKFYVLMEHNDENFYKLKSIITRSEMADKLTFKEADIRILNKSLIVQLLLNALGTYKSDFLKVNNLTGHFYAFDPRWSKWGKYRDANLIKQVICLEFVVEENDCINMPVRTFTNIRFKSQISFRKKRFEEYPKYIYAANHTLRRKLNDDKKSADEIFIMRQFDGKKSDITFLNLSDMEAFEASKVGMLHKVVSLFNRLYSDIVSISFTYVNMTDFIDHKKSATNTELKLVNENLQRITVKIIDEIGTEISRHFCEDVKQLILSTYGQSIQVKIGKNIDKSALNIVVIHNKQYYFDIDDIHNKSYAGTVQHITLEDFNESSKYAIKTVMNDVLIKNDLRIGKITMFPWSGFDGDISFGTAVKDNDSGRRYFFMKISPDGMISFKEQKLNLFEMEEYYDLTEIYETDSSYETIRGIIKDDKGNINIIRDTGWFTMPEMELVAQELQSGNNKIRGKEARSKYLSSILDLKIFEKDGVMYYFSGIIGDGMQAKVDNAANIRRIEPYKQSKLILDELLPLMDTTLIRNGQLTILPYPFKYLREYINMIKGDDV